MSLLVPGRLYCLCAAQHCHRCARSAPVLALAAREVVHVGDGPGGVGVEPYGDATIGGELLLLCDLSAMPETVYALLRQRSSGYGRQYPVGADEPFYYGNHCRCGVEFHDVSLLSGVGAAFAPGDAREAASVSLERLPTVGAMRFEGGCFHGAGDLIWRHGRVA